MIYDKISKLPMISNDQPLCKIDKTYYNDELLFTHVISANAIDDTFIIFTMKGCYDENQTRSAFWIYSNKLDRDNDLKQINDLLISEKIYYLMLLFKIAINPI